MNEYLNEKGVSINLLSKVYLQFIIASIFLSFTISVSAQGLPDSCCFHNLGDTIHVSGIVSYTSGKPAKDIHISTKFSDDGVNTFSDSTGRFYLKNVRMTDTLYIRSVNYSTNIINKGSRFLYITVPPKNESRNTKTLIKIESTEVIRRESNESKIPYKKDTYFITYEVSPEFPGGYKKLHDFIKGRLIYPENALTGNIEGEVVVQFMISEDGTPKDFTVISGLSKECDEAAMNALKGMPKWRPGIFYGRRAEYPQKLAIQFSIAR